MWVISNVFFHSHFSFFFYFYGKFFIRLPRKFWIKFTFLIFSLRRNLCCKFNTCVFGKHTLNMPYENVLFGPMPKKCCCFFFHIACSGQRIKLHKANCVAVHIRLLCIHHRLHCMSLCMSVCVCVCKESVVVWQTWLEYLNKHWINKHSTLCE